MSQNSITKTAILKASLTRVWKAISNSEEFGIWFGMELEGPFQPDTAIHGSIQCTKVDAEAAKMQAPYVGVEVTLFVERIESERLFSFRWHPYGIDKSYDYSEEPTTLVEFRLEEVDGGVRLTITESGFENIPEARRAAAFQANEGGWSKQIEFVAKYMEG
jgi:uncharacterized protein YndB with AHSA1/START domain